MRGGGTGWWVDGLPGATVVVGSRQPTVPVDLAEYKDGGAAAVRLTVFLGS